jgi:hypothetical protein
MNGGMKKMLVMVGLLSGDAMGAFAQGLLDWNSQADWLISVYSPSPPYGHQIQTGNSPQDVPAGTTTYTGGFIGGSGIPGVNGTGVGPTPSFGVAGVNYQNAANFEVGLYVDVSAAAVLADMETGLPVATTDISDGALVPVNTLAYIPDIPGGTPVNVGLAAWYTDGGRYGNYAAAFLGGYSISANQLVLGTLTGTPVLIGPGLGLDSFSLADFAVPEPSTIALGVIGAAAFLLRLRRG